jgi:uncharacterized protein
MMDIARQKYVSFTTFRRDGTPVATPVWIARLADGRVGFTTDPDVGKVKRLRNNPAVTLQACTVRGQVDPDAEVVTGRGEVVTGDRYDEVWRAVRGKYRLIANGMHVWATLKAVVRRPAAAKSTAIVITLD